jgi:hypothetical protein
MDLQRTPLLIEGSGSLRRVKSKAQSDPTLVPHKKWLDRRQNLRFARGSGPLRPEKAELDLFGLDPESPKPHPGPALKHYPSDYVSKSAW